MSIKSHKKIDYAIIWNFVQRYKSLSFLVMILSLFNALFEMFYIAIFYPVFNSLFNAAGNNISQSWVFTYANKVIELIPTKDSVLAGFILILILVIIKTIIRIVLAFVSGYTSGEIQYDLLKKLLQKYNNAMYAYFLKMKQGKIINYTLDSTRNVGNSILALANMILFLVQIIGLMTLLFMTDYRVALFLVVLGFGFSLILKFINRHISYEYADLRLRMRNEQMIDLNEFLMGIKQLIIYHIRDRWIHKILKSSKIYRDSYVKVVSWNAIPKTATEAAAFILLCSVGIFFRLKFPGEFVTQLPLMAIFAMAMMKILPAVSGFASTAMALTGYLPDAERVIRMIEEEVETPNSGKKQFEGFKKQILFKNIYYTYGKHEPLIKGINLTVEKNKVTALVGGSGAGKTTIVNLLLGLYNLQKGQIEFDGVDMREYSLKSIREKIGFVSQDSFVFHSTIEENITFGEKKYSRENVIAAAKLAHAHDFIVSTPNGYDTVVGEKGMRLSGGQQQRISIARAIIRKPEILIFDEATSALDNITEKAVQEAIQDISKEHTIIIIAHRLTTVKDADKIVVLKEGKVVEEGTHQELLDLKEYYYGLYQEGNK